jgi:hypothetical protein
VLACEGEEARLELAASDGDAGFETSKDRLDRADAPAAGIALNEIGRRQVIRVALHLGLIHSPLDPMGRQDRGEIHQRTWDRGHGNALFGGHFIRGNDGCVNIDARPSAMRGGGRLYAKKMLKSQQPRGCAVAEHRPFPSGQHRPHPAPLPREPAMADCVDAPV